MEKRGREEKKNYLHLMRVGYIDYWSPGSFLACVQTLVFSLNKRYNEVIVKPRLTTKEPRTAWERLNSTTRM